MTTQVGDNTLQCAMTPCSNPETGQAAGLIATLQEVSTKAPNRQTQLETIAAMAEEMRTPMTTILSYVDLLLSETVGALEAPQRKFLRQIKSGAEQVVHLSNDLLDETTGEKRRRADARRPSRPGTE